MAERGLARLVTAPPTWDTKATVSGGYGTWRHRRTTEWSRASGFWLFSDIANVTQAGLRPLQYSHGVVMRLVQFHMYAGWRERWSGSVGHDHDGSMLARCCADCPSTTTCEKEKVKGIQPNAKCNGPSSNTA